MKSISPLQILSLFLLLLCNWMMWNRGQLFLIGHELQSTPPDPSITLSRTADDIARGVLAMQGDLSPTQEKAMETWMIQGLQQRQQLSDLQGTHIELQLKLLDQGSLLMEMTR